MSAPPLDLSRVRRNFSASAGDYDDHAVVQKRVVERLAELLLAEGPLVGATLDVGVGTGELTARLLAASPAMRPVIADLAHGMTRHAAARIGAALPFDGDAQSLPLASGRIAAVVSSSVYQWVNDLFAAFAESARVLAPGGRFAFALFGERTLFELRHAFAQALAEGGGEASHAQEFPEPAAVEGALVGAGFEGVRVFSEEEIQHHPDVPDLLRSLKRIGAANAASGRPAGLASRRVMARMTELYGQHYGSQGTIPATYQVIYGFGRKREDPGR